MCISFQPFSRGNMFGGILSTELDRIQFWALPGIYLGKIENHSLLYKLFNELDIPSQPERSPLPAAPWMCIIALYQRPHGYESIQPIKAQHQPGHLPSTDTQWWLFMPVIQNQDLALVLINVILNKPHKPSKSILKGDLTHPWLMTTIK